MASPTNRIRRRIALFGTLWLYVPSVVVCIWPNPEWFRDGLIMASVVSSIMILVVWATCAVLGAMFSGTRMQWFLAIVLSTTVVAPGAYVSAALILSGQARFDTWHLLCVFAVLGTVPLVCVVAALAGLWFGIDWLVEGLFRPKPSDPR